MNHTINFTPSSNTTITPAHAIEPGHVFVDRNTDGEMVNVVALKTVRIRNTEKVRIFGFVPAENRFASFKLDGYREVDVLGVVPEVTVGLSDMTAAEAGDVEESLEDAQ